jgi:hypothetical protein
MFEWIIILSIYYFQYIIKIYTLNTIQVYIIYSLFLLLLLILYFIKYTKLNIVRPTPINININIYIVILPNIQWFTNNNLPSSLYPWSNIHIYLYFLFLLLMYSSHSLIHSQYTHIVLNHHLSSTILNKRLSLYLSID